MAARSRPCPPDRDVIDAEFRHWARSATRSGAIIAILPGQSPDEAQTEEAQSDYHEHHVRGHLEYFDENDAHAGKRDECPGHHEARTGGSHVRHLLMSVRSAVPKGTSQGLVSHGAWLAVQYPAHGSALSPARRRGRFAIVK
jgi:hypothetical protein